MRVQRKAFWIPLLLICLFSRGCGSPESVKKDDASSLGSLANLLVKESDFSDGWDWIDIQTRQGLEEPLGQNHYPVEGASRGLTGRHGPEEYYVKILHNVGLYNQDVSWVSEMNLANPNSQEESTIDIAMPGSFNKMRCERTPEVAVCTVVAGYERIVSGLTVYVPNEMGKELLEKIVNEALSGIDQRISEWLIRANP